MQGFATSKNRMVWSLIGGATDFSYYGGPVSAPLRGGSPAVATVVSFDERRAPEKTRFCVAQAADFSTIGVSPGQIITLFGQGLGPEEGLVAPMVDGRLPLELGGTRVLVNGQPLALLYAQDR